ncbi:MAG: RlmE family RNA methyltransferase [Salinarimonas sp.]
MSDKKSNPPRALKVKLKKARGRTPSQQRWLQRQLNDPYVLRAKREGYRSRAAFKLLELDEKFKFLKPGQRIVDLGAAPGGWSQVAARKIGIVDEGGVEREKARGKIVGIDLLPIEPMPGAEFVQMDFLDDDAPARLVSLLGGPADVVMSDMAANATGHKKTDHLRIMGLAETGAEFARSVLAQGGTYIAKVLRGGTEGALLADLKRDFANVRHYKPPSSRSDSAELFVIAMGYRGEDRVAEEVEPRGG